MENGAILVANDNKSALVSLELLPKNEFGTVRIAANPNQIAILLTATSIDTVTLDMNFSAGINNSNEGLYWLKQIHETRSSLPIVMLTAYGDVELTAKALKNGVTDFLLKPWDNQVLIRKIEEAYKSNDSKTKNASKVAGKQGGTKEPSKPEMLVDRSPTMLQLTRVVTKIAKTDANILITGKNGTRRKVLARETHRLSSRNFCRTLGIDMGAISKSLFESELLGRGRGAFTGTYESRPGRSEVANDSSLSMDEIGDLSIALQAKLLTVLQNRNVIQIGSNRAIPVSIQLISATNKDIPEMAKQGLLRESLFYRINTIYPGISPLKEQDDDILLSIDTSLRRFTSKYQRPDIRMHEQAIEKLRSYHWPGNTRELQHVIEKAAVLCKSNVIRPKDILVKQSQEPQTASVVPNLEEVGRQATETAILRNNGDLAAIAEQLGVSRQTLYNKLKRFKPQAG